MVTALLIQEIEEKSKGIGLKRLFMDSIIKKKDGYKAILNEIALTLEEKTSTLTDLKDLDKSELKQIYNRVKKYSTLFDKLDEKYADNDYFNDKEIKHSFRLITRNIHKFEFTVRKYLYKNSTPIQTPDYIKENLARLSHEAIVSKLSAK